MSDERGYNGWKNYETWSVGLVIDNDQRTYSDRRFVVADAIGHARQSEYWTADQARLYAVEDAIKDWIERAAEVTMQVNEDEPMSFLWSQLVSAALSEVDWRELAEHWIEDEVEAARS